MFKRSSALLCLLALPLASYAEAGSVTLAWDANTEPDIARYLVVYGNASRSYTASIDVGNTTSYTVTGLADGAVYYFAVRACNTSGLCGGYSNEVSTFVGTLPPAPPFGAVDTPINGATGVTGSIGVTGWALDNAQVTRVRVNRSPVAGEGSSQVYVGDAVLVEGARPDVAAAYPTYPYNTRAGWGYLLLTNMLPNQGNGTYTLHVYADDADGRTTWLGSRTFTASNATATEPFGAIDTPGQGAVASGASYANFGWALTPQPNVIPFNGSTINVVVDGVAVGHPGTLSPRADIQTLFPGYANTNNAVGAFFLNTTAYADGVHTIAWGVSDNGGRSAGIGSRYFTIQNGSVVGSSAAASSTSRQMLNASVEEAHAHPASGAGMVDSAETVWVRKGFNLTGAPAAVAPRGGTRSIVATELERVEIHLDAAGAHEGATYDGHLVVGNNLWPLPFGSTLDRDRGIFYWQPGVGFIGAYELIFTRTAPDGRGERVPVTVTFVPKYRGPSDIRMSIDTPLAGDVAQPFIVAGWAIDRGAAAGTGVDTLHIWAYPVTAAGYGEPLFLGVAEYGDARPDVGAFFGARFTRSAFGLIVAGLSPGTYDVAVFPFSAVSGSFGSAQVVRVDVR